MTDEVKKLGYLLAMGTEDIYLPAYMVPIFNFGDDDNLTWDYIRPMCNLLVEREVCAIIVYGMTKTEAILLEAMNDGMHWTADRDGLTVDLFCTNYMPEKAVPLLFKTGGIDPIRYPITDAKRRS